MKRIAKVILLSCLTIGMATGCDFGGNASSNAGTSSAISSSNSSSIETISSSRTESSSDASSSSAVPTITGIALNTNAVKKEYEYGDALDLTGLVVTANYSDNTTVPVTSYTTNPANGTTLSTHGAQQVKVSYETFEQEFTITVLAKLTGITLNTDNVKKTYYFGDKLDLTGLVVNANYSDGTSAAVIDYTANPANGDVLPNIGDNEITVYYQNQKAKFTVFAKTITGMEINTANVKKTYEQGEQLDLTGLVVNVVYNDNSKEAAESYTTDPVNGAVLNEIGTKVVTVTINPSLKKTFTINVTKATKKNWTEDEAKIMSDHLYGVVLPYTGFEESVVSYNASYDTVYVIGGDAIAEDLEDYARAMSFNGFILSSSSTNSYSFRKTVSTDAGDRFVKVVYYINEDAQFYLEAYDPYVYEFPSAVALYLTYNLFGSTEPLPAYTADRYQVDVQNTAIYCYTTSTTAEADYTSILKTAGWDTTAGYDESTKFYSAVSPNKTYMIYYHYEGEPFNSLDIYLLPVNFWNDEPIKAFYAKYTDYTIDIPGLNVVGANYLFEESELNADAYASGQLEFVHAFMYVIGGTAEHLAPYAELLTNYGWEVVGSGTSYSAKKAVGTKGLARIEFSYDRTVGVIVTFYAKLEPFPLTGWPYEEVASILGEDITDTIPAYTGANKGFTVLNDYFGTAVVVEVETGTESAAIATYKNILTTNGYELVEGMTSLYISPNKQIYVSVYMGTSGSFTIDFYAAPYFSWPTTKIAATLNKLFGSITEVLPAFEGGIEYSLEEEDAALYIEIELGEADADKALETYIGTLTQNKFSELGADADGDMHYLSEKGQLDVCPYVQMDDLYIYVTSFGSVAEKWPATAINTWLTGKGFTDTLPEYTGEYVSAVIEEDYPDYSVVITLDNPSADDISNAMDLYCYTLYQSSFKHTATLPFDLGEEYTSPNEQFTVIVSPTDDGFELLLDEAAKDPIESGDFPMDDVLVYFPQANGVMPSFEGGASYEFEGYEGWCGITIAFNDLDTAKAKYDEYVRQLTEAGFTAQEVWGGYSTAYFSPDGTFAVLVTDYFTENSVYIDVYDPDIAYF